MKFTLSWLKDHLKTKATVEEISNTLSAIGLEVESVQDPGEKLGAFRIARIVEAKQHPNADRLRIVQVEIEKGKPPVEVAVVLPKEGAQAVMDVMAIPADAKHPENAHAFINFMMRPDVVGPITNAVGYANAVDGAEAFVSKERLDDPVVYPSKETKDRMFVVPPKSQAFERMRTRTWTRIKSGQ